METSTERATSEGTVTILFTDLEGSTDLRIRVGDEVANELIHTHERLIRTQLQGSGGIESKSLGDGFMILFPSARQAIRTAVSIQRVIEEHNRDHPELPIKVRMGLNTGDVTQQAEDAYGTAVHAAARVASKAQGGQVLMSQIVHDLAGLLPEVRVVDRGLFWLKGFPKRWRLFEVLWRDKSERSEPSQARGAVPKDTKVILDLPRGRGPVVGRKTELEAIREEIAKVQAGELRAVILEGEAGIGKTRVLEAASEMAMSSDPPLWALEVAADEELRGPFVLFRTLIGAPRVSVIAEEAMALEQLERARDAIGGRDSFRQAGLSPQEQMLRVFDEVAAAFAALARERPLALLVDDLQWADEDSIRLVRYLVRTLTSMPIFVLLTMRPYSDWATGGASNLVADLERMHLARRMRVDRFRRGETSELLDNLLGASIAEPTLDSLHARAEGVPFFIEEFARAYREAKVLQLIDGTWTMTRLSGPAVPASVQSLIARRLAQLSEETHRLLADAAVLGRRFRLSDLSKMLVAVEAGTEVPEWQLEESLRPAVTFGIVVRLLEGSDADYSFTHDQIRAALVDSSSRQRKRAIHGAIADILASGEGPENLSTIAYHALHAGDEKRAVSFAIRAARASLDVHAPEESIRIIDSTLSAASAPGDRLGMLRVKDDALALLDRGQERMANLAEMGALTGAVADPSVEMEVKLRRASAARTIRDFDAAADLARQVREAAAASGDAKMELDACLELGQAITHSPLGEGFWPLVEIDLDAGAEPFIRALELARELGDRSKEATSLRELAVLEMGRAKLALMAEAMDGAGVVELFHQAPTRLATAKELANQAFHIYEELGDRRGAMSALISMAYAHVADPTARGMAGRLEQVRRLHHSRQSLTTESQRAIDDALMLYSIHVFARANVHPDLALERGQQAFAAARSIGDRWLEFLAAGGLAMTFLSLDYVAEAEAWVDRAATAALAAPRPASAGRLEVWRGMLGASKGEAEGLVSHLEKAADLAAEQGSSGGRCEVVARLAIEAAKLGVKQGNQQLLDRAEAAATEARDLLRTLSGRLPWEAMAFAATSLVAQAQGRLEDAAEAARSALAILAPRFPRTHYLDVLWAAGRALITEGAPEAEDLAREIYEDMVYIDETIVDQEVKARWFSVPMHRELAEMAQYQLTKPGSFIEPLPGGLEEDDVEILRLLTSGSSDQEIAMRIGANDQEGGERVSELLEKLGVSSRTAAAEFAVKAGIS